MPFRSKSQMKFMFARKPEMAKEFADKTKNMKGLPEHKMEGGYVNAPAEGMVKVHSVKYMPAEYWHGGEARPGEYLHEERYPESGRELERKRESEIDAVPDYESVWNTPGEHMYGQRNEYEHGMPSQYWKGGQASTHGGGYHDGSEGLHPGHRESPWNTPGEGMSRMSHEPGLHSLDGHYMPSEYMRGGEVEDEERDFLEQDDESDGEYHTGHQEHYAHGGYLNDPYSEDETREREEGWEYPESQSNVYGNTEEPEKWSEMGDLEENPDIDEEEEDQKSHARGKGFARGGYAEGGDVGRKNASSATETGMTRSGYDPYEEATPYSAEDRERSKSLDREEESKSRYARAIMRRR